MNDVLTVKEVAAELRCSKPLVYKLLSGAIKDCTTLPHIALGRKRSFDDPVSRRGNLKTKLLR